MSNNIGYIICETATTMSDNIRIVKEENKVDSQGNTINRLIAEGIVQTADETNRNGRWYGHEELFPQLTAPRTVELLEAGYLRAETGHPLSTELSRQQTIDGKLCCAKFLKFWTEGMDVCAKFTATNNAYGDEFNADLQDGCKPAWSLRALGTIENTKNGAEVHNLKLITYDNVIYPSHPRAYTKGIVSESARIDDINNNKYTRFVSESAKINDLRGPGLIVPITNDSVIGYIKDESLNFKNIKESFDLLYESIQLVEGAKQVQLIDKSGNILRVNLETYIYNEIMNYAMSRM